MLQGILIFFVIAILSAIVGFWAAAGVAATLAKILVAVFMLGVIALLVMVLLGGVENVGHIFGRRTKL